MNTEEEKRHKKRGYAASYRVRNREHLRAYMNAWRHDAVRPTLTRKTTPLIDRLMAKHEPVTESGCWLWTGMVNSYGYGRIKYNRHELGAHRASYEIFNGQIPESMKVCHRCDVPCCVNPSHLFLGTDRDNNQDMIRKGRARYPGHVSAGETNPSVKLTEKNVLDIRASSEPAGLLAKKYNVTRECIYGIRNRRTWRHIP